MTYTINGVGTQICGRRELTKEEIEKWSENLPYRPHVTVNDYYIGTEAFVFFFIPIIPLKTFVHYYQSQKKFLGSETHYLICYYPAGEDKVYWEHVKSSFSFYIAPIGILILLIWHFIPL